MAHSYVLKERAINLRKQGLSLKEVSEELGISKSTASEWLSQIKLSLSAQRVLKKKQILGQYKSVLIKLAVREEQKKIIQRQAEENLQSINFTTELFKLCCALTWWCEGNKDNSMVRFTNSDPTLIKNFLFTLRNGFIIDESKFRILVHLHKYHDDFTQKNFWSNITKIPLNQFYKSYQKINTGKRKKENYAGCIAISYYDAQIAKELEAIYNSFTTFQGAFVNG